MSKYREILLRDILPFWMKNGIDREAGGINTMLSRDGTAYGYDKNVWFMGRTMYTFALCYNDIERNEDYLAICEEAYRFLRKCELDESGRLPFVVNREGRATVINTAYYSETFAAIGCAEYFRATGKEELLLSAEKYFSIAYNLYLAEREAAPSGNEATPFMRALGPSMIMLSTAQTMRRIRPEPYGSIALECAEEIIRHLTPWGLMENVGYGYEFIDTPQGREINPGHSLEAGWFLLAEGIYRNDGRLKRIAKEIIDLSWERGYRDGGIIAFTDCKGFPSERLEWDMKIWWPQCEALIATRLAYSVFGEEKYSECFSNLWEYVISRYPDGNGREWFGYMHYDGTLASTLKGNISKGPFHLPRMLIMLDKIDRGEGI